MKERKQHGSTLIEVLVTLLVTAFGLLGLAGFMARGSAMTVEANQRARAAAVLEDMAGRLRNRKADAAGYVSATVHGEEELDCSGLAVATPNRDLCEWNNLLLGSNDKLSSDDGTKKLAFRGCVSQPEPLIRQYVVTVVWGSSLAGPAPADGCGKDLFGDDSYRRVLRTHVRVADLSA